VDVAAIPVEVLRAWFAECGNSGFYFSDVRNRVGMKTMRHADFMIIVKSLAGVPGRERKTEARMEDDKKGDTRLDGSPWPQKKGSVRQGDKPANAGTQGTEDDWQRLDGRTRGIPRPSKPEPF
jgi:hypothetical protein